MRAVWSVLLGWVVNPLQWRLANMQSGLLLQLHRNSADETCQISAYLQKNPGNLQQLLWLVCATWSLSSSFNHQAQCAFDCGFPSVSSTLAPCPSKNSHTYLKLFAIRMLHRCLHGPLARKLSKRDSLIKSTPIADSHRVRIHDFLL
jgi:hypothetical protein